MSSICEASKKENYQKYKKTKEQDLTEYLSNGKKIGEKLHYQNETSEAEKHGDDFTFNDDDNSLAKLKNIKMRYQSKSKSPLENQPSNSLNYYKKKLHNLNSEEETRKEETSKWLEHHFGSESTKSSKGSQDNLDDIVPSSQNSFINVTMKSQLSKNVPRTKYIMSSDDEDVLNNYLNDREPHHSYTTKNDIKYDRNYELRDTRIDPIVRTLSPPSYPKTHSPYQTKYQNKSVYYGIPLTKTEIDDDYSYHQNDDSDGQYHPTITRQYLSVSPQRSDPYVQFSNDESIHSYHYDDNRDERIINKYEDDARRYDDGKIKKEYVHDTTYLNNIQKQDGIRYPTPTDEELTTYRVPLNKKLYQRTRFAADIPPPPQPKSQQQQQQPQQPQQSTTKSKSKIGESFRKLVGKLRSNSNDRKSKKRLKSNNESRSPSPKENTYQNYNSLDNYGALVNKSDTEEPVAPPRTKHNQNRSKEEKTKFVQRYYLGEDPFSESIYGKEKGYDENVLPGKKFNEKENKKSLENDFKSR